MSSDWVLNRLLSVMCLPVVLIRCNWCAILKQDLHAEKCEIFLKLIPSSYFCNLFYVFIYKTIYTFCLSIMHSSFSLLPQDWINLLLFDNNILNIWWQIKSLRDGNFEVEHLVMLQMCWVAPFKFFFTCALVSPQDSGQNPGFCYTRLSTNIKGLVFFLNAVHSLW